MLKNRVRQYFRNNVKTQRIQNMVSLIDHFEYIVCETEAEALILECNLIKKNMPKFNVLLKDDKTYPYIKINIQNDYPDLYITRRFFAELSSQTQGGIIEFYLLEHIRYNRDFFGIKIAQFESIEVFVPNGFFYQNYSSRIKDTAYNYNEDDKIDLKADNINIEKEKIILPNKNIMILQF